MKKIPASQLKVGDIILPPARELQLWMRKSCAQKGLDESALHLTIAEIEDGLPDKNGAWLIVRCNQTPEWLGEAKPYFFTFKARPETMWPVVE